MTKACCGTSVGVTIYDEAYNQMLMIRRSTAPAYITPVTGHALGEHASYEAAAREKVAEETGLKVTGLTRLPVGGFHPGQCRRQGGNGHTWELYEATVEGDLAAFEREGTGVGWWETLDFQFFADRTATWARGQITEDELAVHPGLDPVWMQWMSELGLFDLPASAMNAIKATTVAPPSQH
ncbi:NUDIX hydrolase [Nocardiopsis alba]|uniref:NUDIX hydrolase n=1 Tax=Nocardiopsis alba TaxID=53437 RepID=UPI00366E1D43